jgi:hypothetical protein
MTVLDIKLVLPDDIAREAAEQGLLVSDALEQLIRAELNRRKHQDLRDMLDQLAALKTPPLTGDELNDEIQAVRAERRLRNALGM